MGTIGENVKMLRLQCRWTQKELGQIVNTAENYIGAIENGTREPGRKLVTKLAEAFGVDESTVRYGERDLEKETSQVPEHLRRLMEEVTRVFPDSASLVEKSEKLSKVMRDLRDEEI